MTQSDSTLVRWIPFAIVSALFFQITASTFTSLGVAFAYMVPEMQWTNAEATLGFTILALLVGIAGQVPALTIRYIGIAGTFLLGGAIMAIGFTFLATTNDLTTFYLGAGFAGLGYTLCGSVPALYVINQWLPDRRSFAIGAYFTIGGLGGIVGPSFVPAIVALTGSWRDHWWTMGGTIILLVTIASIFIRDRGEVSTLDEKQAPKEEKLSNNVYRTTTSWSFWDTVKTPQYAIIVAAMTMTLFGGVTMNAVATLHMGNMGVAVAFAAGALSAHQAVNSAARGLGGLLATRIDAKWLLVAALAAETIGMIALAYADNPLTIAIFAIGEGFGFGMCIFATAILLLNYFGPENNPALFGTMHFFTTLAAIGPYVGGLMGDTFGGFGTVFLIYAGVLSVVLAAAIWMKSPVKPDAVITAD
ncbi:MAG: MFS transporter [Proteobacteria bacterium]|nr:MFS transporter [Pseudomonadota bacterium]